MQMCRFKIYQTFKVKFKKKTRTTQIYCSKIYQIFKIYLLGQVFRKCRRRKDKCNFPWLLKDNRTLDKKAKS